jgi:cation:H+ antiporter
MLAIAWCVAGLVALVAGAELVVRAGSRVAARLGLSPLVIGLTVVAVGTSAPELAVGIEAALRDSGPLVVGNIAGTNTFNLLFILGLSAAVDPLAVHLHTVRLHLPAMIAAALALMVMAWDGTVSRLEGAALALAAVVYTVAVVRSSRRESRALREQLADDYRIPRSAQRPGAAVGDGATLVGGIALTVIGADWLVRGAVDLARRLDVSEALIGLTIVAVGTSAPELVTTAIGTLRRQRDIAIGNLVGSSAYNILGVLGVTGCVAPLAVDAALLRIDLPVMTAVALVCLPVFVSGRRISRPEGALFVAAYVVYLTSLIATRT